MDFTNIKRLGFAAFLASLAVANLLWSWEISGQQEEYSSGSAADLQDPMIAQNDNRWRLLDLPVERSLPANPGIEPPDTPVTEYELPLLYRLIGYFMDLCAVIALVIMLRMIVKRIAEDV